MEHHFNTHLAGIYGIEEAILLHYFYHWIAKNAANDNYFFDNLYWTFNTKKVYAELFPYMSEAKISRVIKHLEDEEILKKGSYSTDKWDRTNWYAISQKGIEILRENGYETAIFLHKCKMTQSSESKLNHRVSQNDSMLLIKLNNNNDDDSKINKEEIDKSISKKDDKKDFVERIYKLYPSKCPIRHTYLGKCSKDKERIKRLLKTYTEDEIERVVKKEIEIKYGKTMMQNFSTFLNNFPDPNTLLEEQNTSREETMSNNDELVINGQVYR